MHNAAVFWLRGLFLLQVTTAPCTVPCDDRGLGSMFHVQCSTLMSVVPLKTGNRLFFIPMFVLAVSLQVEHQPAHDARGGWVVSRGSSALYTRNQVQCSLMKTGNRLLGILHRLCWLLIAGGAPAHT